MVIPVLPRVNTIGIRFTKGLKTDSLMDKIVEDKLGIPAHEKLNAPSVARHSQTMVFLKCT